MDSKEMSSHFRLMSSETRSPDPVREAVHDPSGARAVALALLTDREQTIRAKQMQYVEDSKDALLLQDTKKMVILLEDAPPETRLPLVDLLSPRSGVSRPRNMTGSQRSRTFSSVPTNRSTSSSTRSCT